MCLPTNLSVFAGFGCFFIISLPRRVENYHSSSLRSQRVDDSLLNFYAHDFLPAFKSVSKLGKANNKHNSQVNFRTKKFQEAIIETGLKRNMYLIIPKHRTGQSYWRSKVCRHVEKKSWYNSCAICRNSNVIKRELTLTIYRFYVAIKRSLGVGKMQAKRQFTCKNSGFMCSPAIKLRVFKLRLAPTPAAAIWTARHGAEPLKEMFDKYFDLIQHSKVSKTYLASSRNPFFSLGFYVGTWTELEEWICKKEGKKVKLVHWSTEAE